MPPRTGRGKWPSPGNRGSRGRPSAPRGRLRDFLPSYHTAIPSNGFSMKDEARNTASHQSSLAWTSGDAKLRQRPVTFVSAGVIEPLKEEESLDDPVDPSIAEEPTRKVSDDVGDTAEAKGAETPGSETVEVVELETTVETFEREEISTANPPFQEQGIGDSDPIAGIQESETKDLFFYDFGEDEPQVDLGLPPPKVPSPRPSVGESDSSDEVILFRGRSVSTREAAQRSDSARPGLAAVPSETSAPKKPKASAIDRPDLQSATPPAQSSRKQSKTRRRPSPVPEAQAPDATEDDEEDAILADYIANMAADSDDDFLARHLQSFAGQRDLGGDHQAVNFGSGDEKSPMGDDVFADEESESSGSSDAEEDDHMSGNGDEDMDADMDDETLARLFAKQEELGMGGDDLVLFSSSFAQTEVRKAQAKRPAKAGSSRALRGPASATQVADAFDNLDLADWSQLTGQSRKRRSKQPPNFNVSDSEIEAALKTAWQRDRERKKSRKLEREAVRAEGLLGKHANPDDLRVRYPSGMKLDDIKAELTSFLLGSAERLDFPPLDKHARKVLHELANKFNIKSQSTGKGDQRRPVLYRTNRTVRYAATRVEDATTHVDQAALRIHRKYFHRVDVKMQRTESPKTGGGGRSGHKALTLREGEIVGASVPELGQENKGRTMLEKMGWSKGMALGALDNKGILEPVAQVMKRSKAGLG